MDGPTRPLIHVLLGNRIDPMFQRLTNVSQHSIGYPDVPKCPAVPAYRDTPAY